NGLIYVVGGANNTTIFATTEVYNPSTNTWSVVAPMHTPRDGLGVAAAENGKLYAIGGWTTGDVLTNAVEEYDPATNSWTTRSPMPTLRGNVAVAAAGGRVYAISGEGATGQTAAVEEYDPSTDTWRSR